MARKWSCDLLIERQQPLLYGAAPETIWTIPLIFIKGLASQF